MRIALDKGMLLMALPAGDVSHEQKLELRDAREGLLEESDRLTFVISLAKEIAIALQILGLLFLLLPEFPSAQQAPR